MKKRYIQPREINSRRLEAQNSKSREILPVRDLRTSSATHHYNGPNKVHRSLIEESYDDLSEKGYVGFSELDKEKLEKSLSGLDKKLSDRALAKFRWKRVNLLLAFTFGCVFILFARYIYM